MAHNREADRNFDPLPSYTHQVTGLQGQIVATLKYCRCDPWVGKGTKGFPDPVRSGDDGRA
jgi:hypothetical protein